MVNLKQIIDLVEKRWEIDSYRHLRLPLGNKPTAVDALWTDKGLKPTANNLAFIIQQINTPSELKQWNDQLKDFPVRGYLLVEDEQYHLGYYNQDGEREKGIIEPDELASELNSARSRLFTPKALSEFRSGQLSLSDLEDTITPQSFSFLCRERAKLDQAFQDGIEQSLKRIPKKHFEVQGHIIRIAIAFLAARILEDKQFFDNQSIPTNDPKALLNKTVSRLNGFFKRSLDVSFPYLEEYLPDTFNTILQVLATNLGNRVTFALVDHRDVGILYETAIKKLPTKDKLTGKDWGDLQRHYTPVAIAERMLELLPLERIRPDNRIIFDPAAGSGSLLLAATSRLAGMRDIPEDIKQRQSYLGTHVIGNDLDQYAQLVTQLRYILAQESLGKNGLFPSPEQFYHKDYTTLNKENLGFKPSVVVANPPFAVDGDIQRAVKFIEYGLSWLEEGSQFSFILPQSFLTGAKFGVPKVRELLTETCQIFEVWQFPEGTIGIKARQPVCIVSGSLGKSKQLFPSMSKAVFSGAKTTEVRDNGFLGGSWISQIEDGDKSWETAPKIEINPIISTVPLGDLFYIFNGVKPDNQNYPPIAQCLSDIPCKRYWQMQWREKNRLWADYNRVPREKRWIRYGKEYLKGHRLDNARFLDYPKLLISRDVNRSSYSPLLILLDTEGLCPNNQIFCLLPIEEVNKHNKGYSKENISQQFRDLSNEGKRLWLLGILSSEIANNLSLIGRNTRGLAKEKLLELPLPAEIDHRIIEITRQIIKRDQQRLPIPEPDELRRQLNQLVEESYGNPKVIEISRTGKPIGLEEWKEERTKPTLTVTGQVLEVSQETQQIYLYLGGLMDDEEEQWIDLPQEIPAWALDGTVFSAELSEDIETFEDLKKRPWGLRKFRHTPYPYLTNDELREKLRIETIENRVNA